MPTKLADGSAPFWKVSRETAMPVIPENPSPPPPTPRAVGAVTLASARVKVIPSAPEPDPMKASKATVRPVPGCGVGQNAEPACPLAAAVNCRLGGDAVRLSCDEPLSCHPPATGEG